MKVKVKECKTTATATQLYSNFSTIVSLCGERRKEELYVGLTVVSASVGGDGPGGRGVGGGGCDHPTEP